MKLLLTAVRDCTGWDNRSSTPDVMKGETIEAEMDSSLIPQEIHDMEPTIWKDFIFRQFIHEFLREFKIGAVYYDVNNLFDVAYEV